jgi:hypothetical protein
MQNLRKIILLSAVLIPIFNLPVQKISSPTLKEIPQKTVTIKKAQAATIPTKPNPKNEPEKSAPQKTPETPKPETPPVESAPPVEQTQQIPSAPVIPAPLTALDIFNAQASDILAQLILAENAAANGGQSNFVRSMDAKDVALATTECTWNNERQSVAHNYIPAPGGQNVAGGHIKVPLSEAGARQLAEKLFKGYVEEKTGYNYLLQAGFTPQQIVNEGAKITIDGVTYSEAGMAGTGFEKSAVGGVVSHYSAIANQVSGQQATKFSVSVLYDPTTNFVSTAADFFQGNVSSVYQMNSAGQMVYVNY